MEESWQHTAEAFESVWRRVTGRGNMAAAPSAADEDALFGRFIRDAYCSAQYYSALARLFPSSGRSVLLAHAQECKARYRLLRAEYFIRSGEMQTGGENCPLVGGKLASLRAIMLRETEQAAAFRRTAHAPVSEPLRSLCLRFAQESEQRAQSDRALLLECF